MSPSELSRQAWLLMLRQGGWWTMDELAADLHPQGPQYRQELINSIKGMVTSECVAARPNEEIGCMQYAVLPRCSVLKGMTVGEVQL